MKPDEYAAYDALGLKALLDKGEVSARELHDIAINAIDSLNPKLNFLIASSPDEAQRALAEMDLTQAFAGIPFLMKEGVGMAGQPAVMGARMGKDYLCQQDSELVRRLKRTGIVTLGSTNTPEFGSSPTTESVFHGPARNPWHLDHSTGGSSGGASAAVAAGIVPMAQSSDGGGSIRTPAHCCGVFGLLPTRGRTPNGPNSYGASFGIARSHVTTRSVRDSAAMLDQLQGSEPGALFRVAPPQRLFFDEVGMDPGRLRVAFSTINPSGEAVHPDCIAAVEKAVKLCEDLGHDVAEAAPAYGWDKFSKAFSDNWNFILVNSVEKLEQATGRQAGPDTLEKSTLIGLALGQLLTPQQIHGLLMDLYYISRDTERFFEDRDILITPTCATPAPLLGEIDSNAEGLTGEDFYHRAVAQFAPFTAIFNASGQPAMSVPLHQSTEGLPVGIQCAARFGDEATLIRLAAQFEQACPWVNRRPPIGLCQ